MNQKSNLQQLVRAALLIAMGCILPFCWQENLERHKS